MEAIWLLLSLRKRGFVVRPEGGKIMIGPSEKLTPADIAAIKQHRDELLSYLDDPAGYAAAERAYHDEPDWSATHTVLRESVIVSADGFPVMAMSTEFVAAWTAWNQQVDEARAKQTARDAAKVAVSREKAAKGKLGFKEGNH